VYDDALIDDHGCTCGGCIEALAVPEVERLSEQHASVRFGDSARHPKVLVDGKAVEDRSFEAIGGDSGRAWCFRGNDWGTIWHTCRTCGAGACLQIMTGKVEIVWGA
jgi:hypothetical protein